MAATRGLEPPTCRSADPVFAPRPGRSRRAAASAAARPSCTARRSRRQPTRKLGCSRMPSRRSPHVHVCIFPRRGSRSTARRSSSLTAATAASPCGRPRLGCATEAASAPRAAARASCCAPPASRSTRSTCTWPTRATTVCASSRTAAPSASPSEGAAALVETRPGKAPWASLRGQATPRAELAASRPSSPPGPGRPLPRSSPALAARKPHPPRAYRRPPPAAEE